MKLIINNKFLIPEINPLVTEGTSLWGLRKWSQYPDDMEEYLYFSIFSISQSQVLSLISEGKTRMMGSCKEDLNLT